MKLSIERLKEMAADYQDSEIASICDELIAIRELKGERVPAAWVSASDAKAISRYSNKNNLCYESCLWFMKRFDSDVPLFTAPQKPVVTDEMALAFHFATTDGAAADDDVEDIKTGLRVALSAAFI